MKALIVGDNVEFRALLKHQFESHAWEALEAANGQDSFEMMSKHIPDLILVSLPQGPTDGFQFLKRIKDEPALKSIPLILCSSGYPKEKEEELVLSLGARCLVNLEEPAKIWETVNAVLAPILLVEKEGKEKGARFLGDSERSVMDHMLEGCQIIDSGWRYLYLNDAAARQGRKSREELLGHAMMEVYPGIENTELFSVMGHCMEQHVPAQMGNEFTYPDGVKGWFDLRIEPIPEGLFILSIDETERKRAEEAINKLNASLEQKIKHLAILHQIDRAILSALNLREIFETLDGELQKLIGYDALQIGVIQQEDIRFFALMKGEKVREITTPIQGSSLERMLADRQPILRKDLLAEKRFNEDGYHIQKGLHSFVMLPLISKGKVIGDLGLASRVKEAFSEKDLEFLWSITNQVAIAVENVTLYQNLEEKVARRTAELAVKNRELEELAKMRAEFISTASHDLRAPLTGVLGFAELLLRGRAGSLDDTQQRYIKSIYSSGTDLLSIVDDFLEVSRIDAGRLKLNKQEFNVAEGISHSVASMESLFATKKLQLIVEIEEKLPTVDVDPNRFNQMLTNYLSNALKFTSEGGKVTVRSTRHDDSAKVSVLDTGIGIKQEDMNKLFQRFSQLEETKYIYKGTGLGLAIVKQLAELHGGAVGVESEYGKGATFWFTLPVFKKETK